MWSSGVVSQASVLAECWNRRCCTCESVSEPLIENRGQSGDGTNCRDSYKQLSLVWVQLANDILWIIVEMKTNDERWERIISTMSTTQPRMPLRDFLWVMLLMPNSILVAVHSSSCCYCIIQCVHPVYSYRRCVCQSICKLLRKGRFFNVSTFRHQPAYLSDFAYLITSFQLQNCSKVHTCYWQHSKGEWALVWCFHACFACIVLELYSSCSIRILLTTVNLCLQDCCHGWSWNEV